MKIDPKEVSGLQEIDPRDPTIYERAAKILDENEWISGTQGWSVVGPVCLEGAINRSCGISEFHLLKALEVFRVLSIRRHDIFYGSSLVCCVFQANDRLWHHFESQDALDKGKNFLIQILLNIASDLRREQNLPELDLQVSQEVSQSHEKTPRRARERLTGTLPLVETSKSLEVL